MTDAKPAPDGRPSLFSDLMAVSRAAHAAGRHEVAYHTLVAAMHAAAEDADAPALAQVVHEAEAQIARIDRETPSHRLSTASASGRQHPGVYAMLVRQALAHAEMISPRPASALTDAAAALRAASEKR
jgi:hypothetical protein